MIESASGVVCSVVIPHSRKGTPDVHAPADNVFCDFSESWNGEYESVEQVFQWDSQLLPGMYGEYNYRAIKLDADEFTASRLLP